MPFRLFQIGRKVISDGEGHKHEGEHDWPLNDLPGDHQGLSEPNVTAQPIGSVAAIEHQSQSSKDENREGERESDGDGLLLPHRPVFLHVIGDVEALDDGADAARGRPESAQNPEDSLACSAGARDLIERFVNQIGGRAGQHAGKRGEKSVPQVSSPCGEETKN